MSNFGRTLAGVCLVLACVALVLGAAEGEKKAPKNLVVNGDFEKGPAGPESKGKLPPGWEAPFATVDPIEIVKETRPGSTGKQCLKINTSEQMKTTNVTEMAGKIFSILCIASRNQ